MDVEVKINTGPVIQSDAISTVTVAENGTAQFQCNATGFPRPSIKWQRKDEKILPAGGHTFS